MKLEPVGNNVNLISRILMKSLCLVGHTEQPTNKKGRPQFGNAKIMDIM